jgi:putative sterol carrier protein
MTALEFIKKMPQAFNADVAGDLDATIQYQISTPAYTRIKDGACTAEEGTADSADVTLIIEDDDLVAMLSGELNGMTAFMTGKLQIEGDLMLAQRVASLFDASKVS